MLTRLIKICTLFLLAQFYAQLCFATIYHVAKTGSDSTGNGSLETPWLTIDKCANTAIAGDTCWVRSGIYEESVTPTNDGSSGNLITFSAFPGETVIVRQFLLEDDDYIRIVGFELTHNDKTYNRAILLLDSDNCEIINNYIHNTYGQAVYSKTTNPSSNIIIRGNIIEYLGCPSSEGDCIGSSAISLSGNYNLIEYNTFSQVADVVEIEGRKNIIRNNYFSGYADASFSDAIPDANHVDFVQSNGSVAWPTVRNLWENNFAIDNIETNSHMFQQRDTTNCGTSEIILRGNVAARFGSYIIQAGGVDYHRFYNNTVVDFFYNKTKDSTVGYNVEEANTAENNFNINNAYYEAGRIDKKMISIGVGCSCFTSNNLCYNSGTDDGCSVSDDPLFASYATDNFSLQSGSKARAAGKTITKVDNANGSGTQFVVDDAGFFTDGNGTTTGDRIKVGSNAPVTVNRINYDNNTITVDASLSWVDDDNVTLSYMDGQPDIGAYQYKAGGYTLTGTYTLSGGVVTVTPSDADLVRFVEVWEDGIMVGSDSTSPFSVSGVGSGALSVKMYSMFASKTPIVEATDASLTTSASTSHASGSFNLR